MRVATAGGCRKITLVRRVPAARRRRGPAAALFFVVRFPGCLRSSCLRLVQDNTSFGADFRVGKSFDAWDRSHVHALETCRPPSCAEYDFQITDLSKKHVFALYIRPPDNVRCDLVGDRIADLEMALGAGDLPAFQPFLAGGNDQTSFYYSTGSAMVDINTGAASLRVERQPTRSRRHLPRVDAQQHWERVYRTKRPTEVSWYAPHLDASLRIIEEAAPGRDAHIIDVGGGEATLVDDLLDRGYRNVSVLDVSATALGVASARLGERAGTVGWLSGDVTAFPFARHQYDVWHDRAVFHFLVDPRDRAAYVRQAARAVKPGGHVVVATFGPDGPTRCSGLEVVRYDPDALHGQFGAGFRLLRHLTEIHRTPSGQTQQVTYCYCKTAEAP